MAVATVPLGPSKYFLNQLDSLLFEICEELQLPPFRYNQADERYHAVCEVLEADGSPLSPFRPRIYPQGSMRLGTTVRPITGPHDLDFVCELSLSHALVEPIKLLQALHSHLKQHGTYRDMVSLKNRCVRITYANEFYMDLLPACQDHDAGGTCIQVPDRDTRSWKPSDPIGYAKWFKGKSAYAVRKLAMDSAEPLPAIEAVEDKAPLQLAVQLIKRWRDIHYAEAPYPAPISIVLTTLAADAYRAERSVSEAIASILHGILESVRAAETAGRRLKVINPSNILEDLSERWDNDEEAYRGFKAGIQQLSRRWDALLLAGGNQNAELERLFGEPVKTVLEKRAERLHESRFDKKLSVTSAGLINAGSGVARIPVNTFMARNRYLPRMAVGLALQGHRLLAAYPQFEVRSSSRKRAAWRGTLQPTELSDVYTVEIDYTLTQRPDVHVIRPQLTLHPDHKRLPHVYRGNSLCLYTFGEWHPGLYIANTIVPWISLWLFFYEIWLLTGNWKGGGTHPDWSQHRDEDCTYAEGRT